MSVTNRHFHRCSLFCLPLALLLSSMLRGQSSALPARTEETALPPKQPQSRPQMIHLEVVVCETRPGLLPAFTYRFLKRAGKVSVGILDSDAHYSKFLSLLQVLRMCDLAKLLARPRLVTVSGRKASFLTAGEQEIPVPAGLGSVGVQFEDFNTRLDLRLTVLRDGRVHLDLEPEVSSSDPDSGTSIQGTVIPGRVTDRVKTAVDLKKGQTVVISGLIRREYVACQTRVPILGSLPCIGSLFSRKSVKKMKKEIVILITPHVIDPRTWREKPK